MDLLLGIAGLLLGAVVCGWLAGRAGRLRPRAGRWFGRAVAGAVAAALTLGAGLAVFGSYRLDHPAAAAAPSVAVPSMPARLARGEHLANLCTACHATAEQPPLDGGAQSLLGPLATLYAPNLTPAGPLRDWSDGEVIRAVRDGVDRDGRSLLLMPAANFHTMSDDDVQALVAYLRSQPAVPHDVPPRQVHLPGALLSAVGGLPLAAQPPTVGPVTAPPAAVTPAYGEYLLTISGCRACHGPDLTGGTSRVLPHGPSLVALVPHWSTEQFVSTIRSGRDPNGVQLPPELMPWPSLSATWSDDELRSIDAYIRSLSR